MAKLAELNVKKCEMSHDACFSTDDFKYAGQNIGYRAHSGSFESIDRTIVKVVQSWYDEVINAAQSDIDECCTSESGSVVGHFTQLVTDRATHVGCAISAYTAGRWKTHLMTCNYAFSNFEGMKVYASGDSATECQSGNNPDFPALCSVDEQIQISF